MDFAEELRLFRERCGGTTFDGLVLPGTLQATTAALLIGALEPKRVAFLLTPEARAMPDQVAGKLGLDSAPQNWQRYDEDHTDPLQIYRSLRKIIEAWNDLPRERLAVDVTGGTKPMSIGLAKAAYVLNLPALYVESTYVSANDCTERKIPRQAHSISRRRPIRMWCLAIWRLLKRPAYMPPTTMRTRHGSSPTWGGVCRLPMGHGMRHWRSLPARMTPGMSST